MKISDILEMSLTNLWRRKTRTLLTVLGVVIGTASIVVMLSLGIGLKQATMAEVGAAGGLTEIMVYSGDEYGISELLLDDSTIDKFMEIEFVESVEPQIWYRMPIQVGKYETTVNLIGVSQKKLGELELGQGTLPEQDGMLQMIAGNQVILEFFDSSTGEYPYYEQGEVLDINLMNSSVIAGIEQEESYADTETGAGMDSTSDYYDSTFSDAADDFSIDDDVFSFEGADSSDTDSDLGDTGGGSVFDGDDSMITSSYMSDLNDGFSYSDFTSDMKRVQVKVTGILEGDEKTSTAYSENCYTSIDALKDFLHQNYSLNSIIPGQPTDREGKPYRDLRYSQLIVNVDTASNVEDVLQIILEMGYDADANKEWLEATEKEFMIIEAVLGGIGAVSLLVAAIGIANTMTMSTYERTKEIGIMKVLGCSLNNIRSMFLTEAAFIGLLGGAVGVVLSFALSMLVNQFAPAFMELEISLSSGANISTIPLWLVILSIVFSTIIGMLAGFFPAQRATRLSPLAAIRNE